MEQSSIAGHVKFLVTHILIALDLSDAAVCPDLLVVVRGGLPIGVIAVKKPDIDNGVKGLAHPNLLGELFDIMQHLPSFYGIHRAFGTITNLLQWRVAWLPGPGVDEKAAMEVAWLVKEEDERTEEYDAARENEDDDPSVEDKRKPDRFFHVSKIFEKRDAVRVIASAIAKMYDTHQTPFDHPFDRLSQRTLLKFVKGEAKSIFSTRLKNVTPKWNTVARPRNVLYAIEDLGRGAHGRVWLTCSSSGAICVLKVALDDRPGRLDKEYAFWRQIYPSFPVFRETWCGHPALRMPHFTQIRTGDRTASLELVKDALERDFDGQGFAHDYVFWRNIGFLVDKQGQEKAVAFDMGAIRTLEDSDAGWVDAAIRQLARSC